MIKKEWKLKDILYDKSAFRIAYFMNLLISSVVLLDVAAYVAVGLFMIWAFFILKAQIKTRSIQKMYGYKFLILFFFSALITVIIHFKISSLLNFGFDLVMVYHFAICFFILYGLHIEKKEKIEKEMETLFKAVILTTAVLTTISFFLLFINNRFIISGTTKLFGDWSYEIGMYHGERLTGIYINPNILAFCSVVAIIFCHLLVQQDSFFKFKKKCCQVLFLIFCISINLAALVLSDSIASFLFLILYAVFLMFYKFVLSTKPIVKCSRLVSFMTFLAIGVVVVLFSVFVRSTFQSGAANFINDVDAVFSGQGFTKNQGDIVFGRIHYDLEGGNGRTTLLKQAAFIFIKNPIFGIGIANIERYGDMYFDNGIAFSNFHNGYITILACYGLVGFLLFMAFLITVLLKLIKVILKNNTTQKMLSSLFCVVISYLVYSSFEKTIFSEVNYMGLFFWLMLGYTIFYAYIKDPKIIMTAQK